MDKSMQKSTISKDYEPAPPSTYSLKCSKQSLSASRKYRGSTRTILVPLNDANQYEHWVAIPPDGGWGWVIVVIAFLSYFLMDGVCYTFGIFLSELAESFGKSTGEVAMISSYLTGTYYLSGPIACALCNRLGFRPVGFFGSLASAGLFLIASVLENFLVFTILMGFGVGLCFDMVYTVMLLDVGFYFDQYRAIATAISVLGVSAGIMGFPQIFRNEYLFGSYHWRTKFKIIGACFLVMALLTLALKPIKPTLVIEELKLAVSRIDSESTGTFDSTSEHTGFLNIKNFFRRFHNILFPTVIDYTSFTSSVRRSTSTDVSTFLAVFPHAVSSDDESVAISLYSNPVSFANHSIRRSRVELVEDDVHCSLSHCCKGCFSHLNCYKERCNWCRQKCNTCWRFLCCIHDEINRPMYRDDILYPASLALLPDYSQPLPTTSIKSVGPVYSERLHYHLSVSRVITQKDIEEHTRCVCCPEAILRVVATMLDLNLMRSPSFTLLLFSGFLTMLGLYLPFIFMVERGEELNLGGEWPTKLLSIMGFANCLGRIACGTISFFPKILDVTVVSYMTLIISGLSLIASAYWETLEGQLTIAILYGFFVALLQYVQSF